ncbi:putative Rossmann fold nucleotide-binding protein DprA/Smf involved in DNA uptake [Kibdelosporangium banguiense]|uniref:Rossmann fold nucleotide-binding protein DprA/Smf involved in DNA uptake n=1 Tax=Kibdelosporangium banguiense TaxID=1365924 RepID=A0ABS4THA0_9PSEU|nr:putative Rossmann fold nucleotide-binding protein DprA/Smf involved in DNA uptake [Kibdelosporangium banguiense]
MRNRLIAALGAGTVVVEAGQRSGARNTAASAAALGRVLMVVPGPVTSPMSIGCHELLREGLATSVSSVAEVVESVGLFGEDLVTKPEAVARPTDGLDHESLRVHEALEMRAGHSAERIAEVSGVPLQRVRAVLPALELTGLADRCDSGWRRVKA